MPTTTTALLVLDLTGTMAFALNGAMTAVRTARLDVFGIITLGMMTALGGGFLRDILLDDLPPATFLDWRYLAVAASGGIIAFFLGQRLDRLATPINVLDAAGLGLFAVTGTLKGLEWGLGVVQAIILGVVTAVGGGTLRDVVLRQVPAVLHSGLYAIPALVAAALTALVVAGDLHLVPWTIVAAAVCFVIRMVGVRYDLHAPRPRGAREQE
ncbi:trimeric intracellular cation channel family protein [Sanguibacter antarcticus]|uniref:Putative membrane protein YeiH n=1 Tax=Sanguibacter antarcticus TaxID=372484 RepID=A0A2A9E2F0_9MICO|nr:TRIC cation channel family protein [Sanguibacter antarcticus]PFG32761.1 putative membrane protein YeiH [Sanguibacter antarcticus]